MTQLSFEEQMRQRGCRRSFRSTERRPMSGHRCYGASITKIFLLVDCELDIFMANPVTGLVGLWGSLIGFLKFSRAFTN
jgi:hypothetical protein